ncbi:MAG: universal stress protein [Sandaracinaceae bacterium]|nr:universal stress protein [Sandaracinaceae bacterium]
MTVHAILCPIDVLDPGERRVLEYASLLAAALDARFYALHVYEVPGYVDPDPDAPAVRSYAERALTEQRERFGALVDHLPGAFAQPALLPGLPHRRIGDEVERLGAGLVVMGTHARRGLSRLALGSIAERVVRSSRVPVLTVPRAGEPPPSPPRSLLVPHDLSTSSRRALALARDLHVPLRASVAVVHVLPDELSAAAEAPAWLTAPERERYRGLLAEALERDVSEVFGPEDQAVKKLLEHGDVVETVLARQAALGAALLVVGASGKSGTERALLGSVTTELLRRSPVPVLTVP